MTANDNTHTGKMKVVGPVTVYHNEKGRWVIDMIEDALNLTSSDQYVRYEMPGPDDLDARAEAQRLADPNADDLGF